MDRKLLISILSLSLATPSLAITLNKLQLNHNKPTTTNTKTENNFTQQQRINLQRTLKETELSILALKNKLTETNKALNKQLNELHVTQKKINDYQKALATHKKIASQEIHAAYLLGQAPLLKILLSDNDFNTTQRAIYYYKWLAKHQSHTLNSLLNTLTLLKQNELQQKAQTETLLKLKNTQLKQQRHLEALSYRHRKIITTVNKHTKTKHQQLQQLTFNKQIFEKTIKQLKKSHTTPSTLSPFAQHKGKLKWPTLGKVTNSFGQNVFKSELKWSGLVIYAHENQPVHAIDDGQVAFANWLPGYGLLMIIDHGDGFMSLYGRNNKLLLKTGQHVNRGEVIATVGKSGGYLKPSLYFAIRHDAKPLNPAIWCH